MLFWGSFSPVPVPDPDPPVFPGFPDPYCLFRVVVQCRVLLHPRCLVVVLLPNPCQLAKLFVKIACGTGIKLVGPMGPMAMAIHGGMGIWYAG